MIPYHPDDPPQLRQLLTEIRETAASHRTRRPTGGSNALVTAAVRLLSAGEPLTVAALVRAVGWDEPEGSARVRSRIQTLRAEGVWVWAVEAAEERERAS